MASMERPVRHLRVAAACLMLVPCAAPLTAQATDSASVHEPLAAFAVLAGGTWIAQGSGFTTRLTYRWLVPGRVLEAANDLHGADGRVAGRYRGAYAWDRGREEVVFWTAGGDGEVHRGRAWWRDGVLWHEAEVSGGEIKTYASAMRPGAGRLEYFADYGRRDAGAYLLDTKPLIYSREGTPGTGALEPVRFMAGCWRGDFPGGASLEEHYTNPSSNLMLGVSRFLRDGRTVQYEFSRITADSTGVVLLPFPGGRPSEHGFRLTRSEAGTAVFEAPEHDFPKRIRYSRGTDGSLTARIDAGAGETRAQEWRMQRVPCGGDGG